MSFTREKLVPVNAEKNFSGGIQTYTYESPKDENGAYTDRHATTANTATSIAVAVGANENGYFYNMNELPLGGRAVVEVYALPSTGTGVSYRKYHLYRDTGSATAANKGKVRIAVDAGNAATVLPVDA